MIESNESWTFQMESKIFNIIAVSVIDSSQTRVLELGHRIITPSESNQPAQFIIFPKFGDKKN